MSQANVSQRIIIYFNQPLTKQAAAEVHKQLKGYLQGYSLAEHSSDVRWILVLNSSLNQLQFNKFKKAFLKNNNVKHIELDQLLQHSVAPRVVPFSAVGTGGVDIGVVDIF